MGSTTCPGGAPGGARAPAGHVLQQQRDRARHAGRAEHGVQGGADGGGDDLRGTRGSALRHHRRDWAAAGGRAVFPLATSSSMAGTRCSTSGNASSPRRETSVSSVRQASRTSSDRRSRSCASRSTARPITSAASHPESNLMHALCGPGDRVSLVEEESGNAGGHARSARGHARRRTRSAISPALRCSHSLLCSSWRDAAQHAAASPIRARTVALSGKAGKLEAVRAHDMTT